MQSRTLRWERGHGALTRRLEPMIAAPFGRLAALGGISTRGESGPLAQLPASRGVRLAHGRLAVHEAYPEQLAAVAVAFLQRPAGGPEPRRATCHPHPRRSRGGAWPHGCAAGG